MHERTRVAFHEAGHAVIAWLHHNRVRDQGIVVHVRPDGVLPQDASERGKTHLQAQASRARIGWEWNDAAHRIGVQWRVEADLVMLRAGVVAEAMAMGFGPDRPADPRLFDGANGDRDEAVELAKEFRRLLHGEVSSSGAVEWIEGPITDRARDLLGRPEVWAAVTRVAYALDRSGRLSVDEFEQLMSEAPPERVKRHWELPT